MYGMVLKKEFEIVNFNNLFLCEGIFIFWLLVMLVLFLKIVFDCKGKLILLMK